MRVFLNIIVLIFSGFNLYAQGDAVVVSDTTVTQEVNSVIRQALSDSLKAAVPVDSSKLAEYVMSTTKQVAKDTLKNYVEVPDVKIDSTLNDQIVEQVQTEQNDDLGVEIPSDSAAVKESAKSKLEQELDTNIPADAAAVKQETNRLAKEELKNKIGIDALDISLDSTTGLQMKDEAVKRVESELKNIDEFKSLDQTDSEWSKLTGGKEQIEKTQTELQQLAAKKELKKQMATHAKEYIAEHSGKIQQVQSKMGELKQKYSTVPNSNDLSTATKRSSLKGESFWKRLVLGGNFNVSKTNPVIIDLSPVLGWKFNKLFEAGITGAYRVKLGAEKNGANTFANEEAYGYSVFVNHMVFKNFFGYLEGENMSTVTGTIEYSQRSWRQSLLLGIGRKFKIAKFLEMQTIISYNFLHDNNDGVYNSPVVFKTGLRVVK